MQASASRRPLSARTPGGLAGAVCRGRQAAGWLGGPRPRGEPGFSELWDVVERGRATLRSAHSSWAVRTRCLYLGSRRGLSPDW